ncbi:efflux RND transporter permease subunit [Sorangium sp. So ce327]|uniref:efflux RND transporter permease subunit n=1 Tax=Sorangium sp. So ce327 TaxID=3133301 RepID=UPI003F60BC48
MQWLALISVRRPVFAAVLMLLVVVLGASGYRGLGVDEFPSVDIPIVIVTARLPGAAPQEVETEVSDKLEAALNTIAGVDELRSTSAEGVSMVVVTFDLSKSADGAAQEVRDKVQGVLGDLPKGIEPPVVAKVDPTAAPVALLAVRSNRPIRETTELADKVVRRRLETIAGVGQVNMIGGRKRQLRVWLDPVASRARGVTATEVFNAIGLQSQAAPGGSLVAGPFSATLRVDGRVASPRELARIVVRQVNGGTVRVEDVARVEDAEEDARSFAQLDSERTVVFSVVKQAGQNTVAVTDAVKAQLDDIRGSLPSDVAVELIRDNSTIIRNGTRALLEHLIVGGLLAALVVLVFLGDARSTLIAAISIPISVIGTFAVMKALGLTLNFLTLLALALAVGIVIDDAIVVLENIVRWIKEKNRKPFMAAVLATREIGLAVLATTFSLLAVFVPVAMMSGIIGRFLSSFGITMAISIAVSMLVSFTLTPAMASRMLTSDRGTPLLARVVDTVYVPMERVYLRALRWVMTHRWVMVLTMVATLGSCGPMMRGLPAGFIPPQDRGEFEVSIRAPEGSSLEETQLIAERIALDVRSLPGVEHTLTTVAEDPQQTANLAKVRAFLSDPLRREHSQMALMDTVRTRLLPSYPKELRLGVAEVQAFSTGSSTARVSYAITGSNLEELTAKSERIVAELRRSPTAVDVDSSLVLGKPEVRARVDRDRAGDLGVRVADISETLRLFVAGLKASTYAESGEQYDVQVRGEAAWRASPEALAAVDVPSSKRGSVPLSSVVALSEAEGPAVIDRLSRQRQVTITANPAAGYSDSDTMATINRLVAAEGLPEGGRLMPLGQTKEQLRSGPAFLLVFVLGFIFMYLVLAAQFDSWVLPISILVTLPLTVPFALLSLLIFQQSLNLFSGLGLLVLFGVVKKNAILQVSQTNVLRARGMTRLDAIMGANRERLRPILMTTLAFVAGMIPLMLAKGIGSEVNHATAGIVLGGQTLSLVLTLLAAPVTYSILDDVSAWFARRRREPHEDRGEQELTEFLGEGAGRGEVAADVANAVEVVR